MSGTGPGTEVLLVEDSAFQRNFATTLLTRTNIAHVCASNGEEAINIVTQSPPERFWAVLMDKDMPVCDGLTATRAIRVVRPDLLIMGLTADAGAVSEAEFRDAGAQGVFSKPLKRENLDELKTRGARH